jgi:hypothetical protein
VKDASSATPLHSSYVLAYEQGLLLTVGVIACVFGFVAAEPEKTVVLVVVLVDAVPRSWSLATGAAVE